MPAPPTPGRLLLTFAGLTTAIGGYIADWNHTHVYNPRWPPHAKFHNGQTMSLGLCLGLSTLYYTWRSQPQAQSQDQEQVLARLEREKDFLWTATWLGCMYWVTQLSAWFYPGSLAMDPEFGEGFPQFWICLVLFGVIGTGNLLERRRIEGVEREVLEKRAS